MNREIFVVKIFSLVVLPTKIYVQQINIYMEMCSRYFCLPKFRLLLHRLVRIELSAFLVQVPLVTSQGFQNSGSSEGCWKENCDGNGGAKVYQLFAPTIIGGSAEGELCIGVGGHRHLTCMSICFELSFSSCFSVNCK